MYGKSFGVALAAVLISLGPDVARAGFDSVGGGGPTLGQMSKNAAGSAFGVAALFEAFLYVLAIYLFLDVVRRIITHAKNSNDNGRGHQAPYIYNIACKSLACIACVAAPTFMGGGITTLFGDGQVQTVKAPPSFVSN